MGNEAIARGALEAGISVATGYPGTPSSEVIEKLSEVAGEAGIYTEWSVNEKVALEVAAAASFAELRAIAVMKQNGVNVAADFILHLVLSGTRGGLVLVSCEDPGFLSSQNEGDSRTFARLNEIPLLEPGDFQEAKDMTKWGLELSEQIGNLVLLRSVTRMSHASGDITFGPVPASGRRPGSGMKVPCSIRRRAPCSPSVSAHRDGAGEAEEGRGVVRGFAFQHLRRPRRARASPDYQQRVFPLQPRGDQRCSVCRIVSGC